MMTEYVDATALCNTDLDKWLGLLRTKLLKTQVEEEHHMRAIVTTKDGHTWIHPALVSHLALWMKKRTGTHHYNNKPSRTSREKVVQQQVAKEWNGQMEVETPVGFIDVLTPTMIIEVKEASKWKHAIGQILAYSAYYPDKEKCIYLFGPLDRKHVVDFICKQHGIKVMVHDEST